MLFGGAKKFKMKKPFKIIFIYKACFGILFGAFAASVYLGYPLSQELLAVCIYIPALWGIPFVLTPILAYWVEKRSFLPPGKLLGLGVLLCAGDFLLYCIPTLPFLAQYTIWQFLLLTAVPAFLTMAVFIACSVGVYWFYNTKPSESYTAKRSFAAFLYMVIIFCVLVGEPIYSIVFSCEPSWLYWILRWILYVLHPFLAAPIFGCTVFRKGTATNEQILLFGIFFGVCSFGMIAIPDIWSVFRISTTVSALWAATAGLICCVSAWIAKRVRHSTQ